MIYASGWSEPEGPVLLPDGIWLLTEMGPGQGGVTRLSPERNIECIAKTPRPNGLARDKNGVIWIAESLEPSLRRLTLDGRVDVVFREANGDSFLWPNDICVGPDRALYMTDSGLPISRLIADGKVDPDYRQLPIDGRVYRIDVDKRKAAELDSGLRFTNGIAFGPEGRLYVTETFTGAIYRYQINAGKASSREEFANVIDPEGPQGLVGPDGMAFGTDGKLYVAVYGQGHVCVLAPDGSVSRRIPTAGLRPSNVAFGPKGEKRIYVTEGERGQFECFDVETAGLPLYD